MDNTRKELIEYLGLEELEGKYIDDYYVIDLYDYDFFNSVYNRLEKNIEAVRDSDQTSLDENAAHVTYLYKDLIVELVAIFDDDDYSINFYEED